MEQLEEIFQKLQELSSNEHVRMLNTEFDNFEEHLLDYVKARFNGIVYSNSLIKRKNEYQFELLRSDNLMEPIVITRKDYILSRYVDLKSEFYSRISVIFENYLYKTTESWLNKIVKQCERNLLSTDNFITEFFKEFNKETGEKHKFWETEQRKDLTFDVPNPKIKWNGDILQLTTLFKQLQELNANTGKPYIECDERDLIKLINENFYNDDHEEFKINSIRRFLDKTSDTRSEKGPFISDWNPGKKPERRPAKRNGKNQAIPVYATPKKTDS